MARNKLSFSSSKEMKYYFLHVQRHRLNYPLSRDCGTFPREIRTQKQTHANYGEYFEKHARISIEMVLWIISCIFAFFLDRIFKIKQRLLTQEVRNTRLRLMFLPTLLSCSSRFLRALKQNRLVLVKKPCLTSRLRALRFSIRFVLPAFWAEIRSRKKLG